MFEEWLTAPKKSAGNPRYHFITSADDRACDAEMAPYHAATRNWDIVPWNAALTSSWSSAVGIVNGTVRPDGGRAPWAGVSPPDEGDGSGADDAMLVVAVCCWLR